MLNIHIICLILITTTFLISVRTVYALMRLLKDAALGVLRNRIEHSLLHFFDTSIKATVSKLRGRERREIIVAHLSDINKSRGVASVAKTADESNIWTIRDDSTLETYPAYSSNTVSFTDSSAVTNDAAGLINREKASADRIEGCEDEHAHEVKTVAFKSPFVAGNTSSVGPLSKPDVDENSKKVEEIDNMEDKECEGGSSGANLTHHSDHIGEIEPYRMSEDRLVEQCVQGDVDDKDAEEEKEEEEASRSRRDNLAMMMGLDESSSGSESEEEEEEEKKKEKVEEKKNGKDSGGIHKNENGNKNVNVCDDKDENESNEDDSSINHADNSIDGRSRSEIENDDMSEDEYIGRNTSNGSDSGDRYMEENNDESQGFLNDSNCCENGPQDTEEHAQNNIGCGEHERKGNHADPDTSYKSHEELCFATGPKGGSDALKGKNHSDRSAKELHEAAAVIFITALGLSTVSYTFIPLHVAQMS